MRAYKFYSKKWGIEALQKKRLKITTYDELNDPFEFLAIKLTDPAVRKEQRKIGREVMSNKGIICFSRSWRNPVLWSHYADKHEGICLGFEIPEDDVSAVTYQEGLLQKSSGQSEEVFLRDEKTQRKLLTTKFKHWGYEDEIRMFLGWNKKNLCNKFHCNKFHFEDFSDKKFSLKEIILGPKCKLSKQDEREILRWKKIISE